MTPDITFTAGSTHDCLIAIVRNGSAFDATGYDISLVAKVDAADTAAAFSLSSTASGEFDITDIANGNVIAKFLPAKTASKAPGNYVFAVKITKATDATLSYIIFEGTLLLKPDITKIS